MNAVFLLSIILGLAGQDALKKSYTGKVATQGTFLFCFLSSLGALLFFLFTTNKLTWDWAFLPYSFFFGSSYVLATVALMVAVASGPLSLTSLVLSYSLLIPTLYGLIFLNDPISSFFFPGLILLILSLFLINGKQENSKLSLKWVISATVAFFGNGLCSVSQKMQQMRFDGAYKNEFMIVALALSVAVMLGASFWKESKHFVPCLKKGWYLGLLCGLLNGMVNLFVMILSGRMPISLMFPLISGGGIVATYLVSRYLYKEILSRKQFIGLLLGVGSVVLLNL